MVKNEGFAKTSYFVFKYNPESDHNWNITDVRNNQKENWMSPIPDKPAPQKGDRVFIWKADVCVIVGIAEIMSEKKKNFYGGYEILIKYINTFPENPYKSENAKIDKTNECYKLMKSNLGARTKRFIPQKYAPEKLYEILLKRKIEKCEKEQDEEVNYWRMAMKVGNQGQSLWEQCREEGIATMTYKLIFDVDFSKSKESTPPEQMNKLAPTQKSSLNNFIYKMKIGDIIYVKDARKIISKGVVTSDYFYNEHSNIIDKNRIKWMHQRKIEWEKGFPEIEVSLGAEQHTVLLLNKEQINLLNETVIENRFYLEGLKRVKEYEASTRNAALIIKKKAESNYSCEICGFNFEQYYGEIGDKYIVAHHLEMISKGERISGADDIALVCSNCHSMIHRKNPPYRVKEIKKMIINRKNGKKEK